MKRLHWHERVLRFAVVPIAVVSPVCLMWNGGAHLTMFGIALAGIFHLIKA